MKQKLNNNELKLMDEVRNEWVNIFNSLEFNEQKAKDLMDFLYEISGNTKPLIFVFDSPLASQYACNIIPTYLNISYKNLDVESQVRSQVGSQVESKVRIQVSNQVENQVRSQVRIQVENQVFNQVESQVKSQVENQVFNQVFNQVESQVENQVFNQVFNQVESQVRSQVGSQVESKVRIQVSNQVLSQEIKCFFDSFYGRCDDYGWISYYDFFERIGIVENKLFSKLKELIKCNLFSSIIQDKFCIISRPPVFLNRDEQGRMHCTTDYAIAFADGFALNYIHGVFFEKELFDKFKNKTLTSEDILSLENAEQKAVLIQVLGYEYIFKSLKQKSIVDEQTKFFNKDKNKKVNYVLFEFKINNIKARVIKVEWYEKNQFRQTFLGVPNTINDAIEAVAWTCYKTKEEWLNELVMEA